jgi:PAS domain S-box-containing protein
VSPADRPAPDGALLEDSAEELFEHAPCGYLTTRLDGTILKINRTFEELTGFRRDELLAGRRFQDLLTAGGRIYHETHYSPLLHMQGSVREIALDIVRADGSRLPALINSVVRSAGQGRVIRTSVFDATDRRRYEEELVRARTREHDVALALQRSLLTGELPDSDRIRTEVVYRPAGRALEVGGDWYDAFWLDALRRVGVVVGDVVGNGIHAASAMGQLRSAVRAYASMALGPGALLEALERYAQRHGVGRMATLAYAEIDIDTRQVRYACAGHPPPAVLTPDGRARLLLDGRSLPLDAHVAPDLRPEATFALPRGGVLMFYSDGLVERRDRPLKAGLDALVAALESIEDAGRDGLCETVADELLGAGAAGDDVCVLATRLTTPRARAAPERLGRRRGSAAGGRAAAFSRGCAGRG